MGASMTGTSSKVISPILTKIPDVLDHCKIRKRQEILLCLCNKKRFYFSVGDFGFIFKDEKIIP